MNEHILNIIISTLTGVGSSYFVWHFTFKILAPKLNFSDKISKVRTNENNSGYKYRFKIENSGSRNIIDLEVIVKLRIKGLSKEFSNNWQVIYLPTSSLEYKNVAILKPVRKKENLRAVLEIKTYECEYLTSDIFPAEIINKAKLKTVTLEDVMKLGSDSELQIFIFGIDEFSGAKKFFESKTYNFPRDSKQSDIVEGKFEKGSLKIESLPL